MRLIILHSIFCVLEGICLYSAGGGRGARRRLGQLIHIMQIYCNYVPRCSAPGAPHHTLAYYVSTRGWALMQYGIMKYNTLQRWADRAGSAGPGAGRAEAGRQGQANKAGRGPASAASQTSSRQQDLLPASTTEADTWQEGEDAPDWYRDPCHPLGQEPGGLGTVSRVWCWCCHMMPLLSNSRHQYHCIIVNCPRPALHYSDTTSLVSSKRSSLR